MGRIRYLCKVDLKLLLLNFILSLSSHSILYLSNSQIFEILITETNLFSHMGIEKMHRNWLCREGVRFSKVCIYSHSHTLSFTEIFQIHSFGTVEVERKRKKKRKTEGKWKKTDKREKEKQIQCLEKERTSVLFVYISVQGLIPGGKKKGKKWQKHLFLRKSILRKWVVRNLQTLTPPPIKGKKRSLSLVPYFNQNKIGAGGVD